MSKTTHKEMIDWTFQQILEGLCRGDSLRVIAVNIVNGISNMTVENVKAKS